MHEQRTIFTVGHSTHDIDVFVELLKSRGITAVADVRSHPVSRLRHFCRAELERHLKNAGIDYIFLGKELGARRDERECYVGGRAHYGRIGWLPDFRAGIERLEKEATSQNVALMCAEKEPLDCHRTILVGRRLAANGWKIRHILADGSIEEHADTEKRLVREMGVERTLFEPDLTREELTQQAYDKRGSQIAFRS